MTSGVVSSRTLILGCLLSWLLLVPSSARADEVTDWNHYMLQAAKIAGTTPLNMGRFAAIVEASVFDAVNGIERRYAPVHVAPAAPRGASQRAAAVQAAYVSLVNIFPAQKSTFDAQRDASLAGIASARAVETSESIARGIAWGQTVADAIWAWRSTDGFTPPPPPYLGSTDPGKWRPTPPAFASGAGPQFATMTPWAIDTPSQFRPAGPNALGSADYLADLNESQTMGSASSALRTADQTFLSQFWASATVTYLWNAVALRLSDARHLTLSENARLFALLNVAMADAAIACWDAKYYYSSWRPITAIRSASDPAWTPLLPTPAHPEYPSGHSTTSGAAATVLAAIFGDQTPFVMDSDGSNQSSAGATAPPMNGATRNFTSIAAALQEVKDSRVLGGIHFRTACDDGAAAGSQVAEYLLANALQRLNGNGR